MEKISFQSANAYEPQPHWKRVSLCNQKDISIEYFIKPPNHASPLHAHPNAQVLVVLKGKMIVKNHKKIQLYENDSIYIEPNEPHIVINTLNEPSMGLDIFVPGRDFNFWKNSYFNGVIKYVLWSTFSSTGRSAAVK